MNTPALQLQSVSKVYLGPRIHGSGVRDRVTALNDINLTIMPGERIGIIGKNGAGKSTLLRAIGGTLNLTQGRVYRQSFPRMVISLGGSFLSEFTGHENIYMYASLLGMLKKEVDGVYESIVDFAGLRDVINEPLRNYSNGMRARLAFAIATAGTPTIICMDEILSTGDYTFQEKSRTRLITLSTTGVTAVITHHNLTDLCKFATRLIWLEDGHVRGDGNPESIQKQYEATM